MREKISRKDLTHAICQNYCDNSGSVKSTVVQA